MRKGQLVSLFSGLVLTFAAGVSRAGDVDLGAVVGGAVGGGVGAGVGSKVGGTTGAVIGGALGGAAGAAVGSSARKEEPRVVEKERVVVKEKVVVKEVRVAEGDSRSGPPGHGRGKKKGWKKHD